MRKVRMVLILAALLTTPTVFADDDMSNDDNRPCRPIVNACLKAGFGKKDNDRRFWSECMKPLVLGKTVDGVTVSNTDVTTCRTAKIDKMKKELEEMQAVGSKN